MELLVRLLPVTLMGTIPAALSNRSYALWSSACPNSTIPWVMQVGRVVKVRCTAHIASEQAVVALQHHLLYGAIQATLYYLRFYITPPPSPPTWSYSFSASASMSGSMSSPACAQTPIYQHFASL
jgi:hypothetical protein